MKAFLCVHRSSLQVTKGFLSENPIMTKDKWRIRDLEHHPLDPGWERSLYCRCHSVMRNSKPIARSYKEEEVYVLDAVWVHSQKHIIRSMFQIMGIKPCKFDKSTKDFLFRDYYFAPKKESKILFVQEIGELADFKGIRGSKLLSKNTSTEIVKKIKKNYEHIVKGGKPSTIDPKDWKFYRKYLETQHVCR